MPENTLKKGKILAQYSGCFLEKKTFEGKEFDKISPHFGF
jgi:hypothetical protein